MQPLKPKKSHATSWAKKKSCNLSGPKNHSTSQAQKTSLNISGQKKYHAFSATHTEQPTSLLRVTLLHRHWTCVKIHIYFNQSVSFLCPDSSRGEPQLLALAQLGPSHQNYSCHIHAYIDHIYFCTASYSSYVNGPKFWVLNNNFQMLKFFPMFGYCPNL